MLVIKIISKVIKILYLLFAIHRGKKKIIPNNSPRLLNSGC